MGIYDRDYIRKDEPGGLRGGGMGSPPRMGFAGMSRWSVNTWLIVACIVLHIVNLISPRVTWFDPGRVFFDDQTATPPQRLAIARTDPVRVAAEPLVDAETGEIVRRPEFWARPVVDTATGRRVGWQEVNPRQDHLLTKWLHFSTARGFLQLELWRLITFQFTHSTFGLAHLLFNMIGLFFFGPMVERYLGSKRYAAFYLMCGISGALLYLILNFLGGVLGLNLPGVLINDPYTPLVGASAGVYGVLMAGAFIAPNTVVQLIIPPIPLKLKTLAYALLVVSVVSLFWGVRNAGGEAAHIGGAIAGFYFIRRPALLRDFFDDFTGLFGGGKRKAAKAARSSGGPARGSRSSKSGPSDEEVDRILAKVATEGLQSLSEREKRILREASEEQRRR